MDIPICLKNNCKLSDIQERDVLYYHIEQCKTGYMDISSFYQNYPTLHFPEKPYAELEEKVQKQNYNYLVHTMADMIQKYAPEIQKLEV